MADTPDPQEFPMTLTTNDILGIIQRGLMELHGYCGQHPHNVDRSICLAALERVAQFVGQLPPPPMAAANGNQQDVPLLKN